MNSSLSPRDAASDEHPTLQPCETCQSEGRIYRRQGSMRPWETDDIIDCGECPDCEGTGGALIPTEPVTEEEIMESCGAVEGHGDEKPSRNSLPPAPARVKGASQVQEPSEVVRRRAKVVEAGVEPGPQDEASR